MTKQKWIDVFVAAGFDREAMQKWHVAFERTEPDGHEAFLGWLGLSQAEIAHIRTDSVR